MKRLRNWLWSIGNAVVAGQRREIYALRNQIAAMRRKMEQDTDEWSKTQAGVNRTCRDVMAERDRYEWLLNAIKKGIGFDPLDNAWQETPATAMHAVGGHLDQLLQESIRRAEAAESSANDLRGEIRDLQRSLETEQRAHERTRHEKSCTDAENRLLAAIHETDVKRREAERAIEVRREVEAESAADALRTDERE